MSEQRDWRPKAEDGSGLVEGVGQPGDSCPSGDVGSPEDAGLSDSLIVIARGATADGVREEGGSAEPSSDQASDQSGESSAAAGSAGSAGSVESDRPVGSDERLAESAGPEPEPGLGPEAESPEAEPAGPKTSASGPQAGSVWSGRAIGPLSRLLPGGSVDQLADDAPPEQSAAPTVVAAKTIPALAGAIEPDPPETAHLPADPEESRSTTATPESADVTALDGSVADGTAAGDVDDVADASAPPDVAAPAELGLTSTDDRWHGVMVGFVDDPRSSVEAASALVDEDVARHVALLSQRKEAMHAAWRGNDHADTEALRVCLVNYRDLRKRLTDVAAVLNR